MEKISIKSVYFKHLKGLKDVKIEFKKPLTAIMGVNGAGKTTVIHSLACIYRPDGNGEDHRFPEYFIPNTDTLWKGSEFHVVNSIEGKDKTSTIQPSRKYAKAFDRWTPRYDDRPKRNVYYIGIDSCMPEIEKNNKLSRIRYTSQNRSDRLSIKTLEIAAYVLNKDYNALIDNEYHSKHFIGVSTCSGLKYSSLSMGTGEQRTIKLIEKILSAEAYSLILIDEIDLLLHICALRRLIYKLHQIAEERHLQIVFTTHALEVISLTKYVGLQYLDIIKKSDGSSVMMVYDKPSSDIIQNLTGTSPRPIRICVEDDFSRAIIKTIVRKHGVSAKVSITKFGAATNAFTFVSGQSLAGNNTDNLLVVLDGDVYKTDEEKNIQIERVYSGTEEDIAERRLSALSRITQYNLPDDTTPEQFMYNLLVRSGQDNEVVKAALTINATDDPHKLISHISEELNENIDMLVAEIVDIIGDTQEWKFYIKPIEDWILEHKNP